MYESSRRIRVLVADDSHTALTSICGYLELDGQFEIIGTAFDGVHLVEQVESLRPDLVLADLSMPRMNGLEATIELRKSFSDLPILIFSGLNGLSIRDECLRNGANGFVEKSRMPERLIQEILKLFPSISRSGQAEQEAKDSSEIT
jgi:DNA-binding NarL/FixJ family response regulator